MTGMRVRVGDRYVRGEDKITITDIDGADVEVSILTGGSKTVWTAHNTLPLPTTWEKVGSAPEPTVRCAVCVTAEAEPGLLLCFECINTQAGSGNWANISTDQAEALAETLVHLHDTVNEDRS